MCDIVFEKAKRRGGTVNRMSVYNGAAVKRVLLKTCYEKFCRIHKKAFVLEYLFWWFFVNFAEFVRTPSLQNTTGRLLLITVTIVVKGVLENKTANYDTQTKVYVLI